MHAAIHYKACKGNKVFQNALEKGKAIRSAAATKLLALPATAASSFALLHSQTASLTSDTLHTQAPEAALAKLGLLLSLVKRCASLGRVNLPDFGCRASSFASERAAGSRRLSEVVKPIRSLSVALTATRRVKDCKHVISHAHSQDLAAFDNDPAKALNPQLVDATQPECLIWATVDSQASKLQRRKLYDYR